MFLTAIVSVLLRYPMNVIEAVTTDLPMLSPYMPTPYDVRCACENYMQPLRDRMAAHRRIERQLAERDVDKSGPRQTLDEIRTEMAARGIDLRIGQGADQTRAVDWALRVQLQARHGDAYASIPDRPGVGSPPDEKRTSEAPITGKGQQ